MVLSNYRSSGGHENVVNNYCNGLNKLGYNTAIGAFSFEQNPPANIEKVTLKKFRNLDDHYDLINSHQTHINYYSLVTHKPFVFTFHGTSNRIQEINLRISAFLYGRKVSKIISTSYSSLNYLRKVLGKKAPLEVVYNGVDTTFYQTNLPRPYSIGDPQLLFVGNLYHHKNIIKLIEAMPAIIKMYPNAHLHIIGNGKAYNNLNSYITERKMANNVKLLGSLWGQELRLRYASCDIYVSASKLESAPLPPLEAMACGKPILLSDISAHKELTEASNAGRVFSLEDSSDILRKLEEVYNNRYHFGQFARKFVEKYDWGLVCGRIANLYERIISKN